MSTNIVVPALGESVTEATVAQWLKKVGDHVSRDEPLVELETDKVTLEVNAAEDGTLEEIAVEAGVTVEVGAKLGAIGTGAATKTATPPPDRQPARAELKEELRSTPVSPEKVARKNGNGGGNDAAAGGAGGERIAMPAARKLIEEHGLDPNAVAGTGKDGRITKEDVQAHLEGNAAPAPAPTQSSGSNGSAAAATPERPVARAEGATTTIEVPPYVRPDGAPRPKKDKEERVRMSKLRKTIAQRLKQAQNNAAMLTTFNEVDMTALMATRNQYKESFEKKHGVKLGFMSFFTKACITALREIPAVNAEIDGDDIVYKNYYDIGVAVSTSNGLVVPVVRDADLLSFAEVEKTINELGRKARDGKLAMADLTGGTFTISNGGVFGSLMSTPILNPPQSAILGMHKIQERPMAVGGKVEIRPMMYLALSYDHRIIDGREAVTFLVRVKECLEDPQRILLDI